jgi:hypothetical protein
LSGCATCQAELARLQALFTELDSLAELDPPATLVSQVMAQLPKPSQRSLTGPLILAGQMLAGLALLISTFPLLSSLLERHLNFSLWPVLLLTFRSLLDWGIGLGQGWSNWLPNWWPPAIEAWGLNLSPGNALMLVACLGLVWLAGNLLLLHPPAQFLKNRGAS